MQLSKQESKYRSKLCYENGYRKLYQQALDCLVRTQNVTYETTYFKELLMDMFIMNPPKILTKKTIKALNKIGISPKVVDDNFKNPCNLLGEILQKWDT
ncbi:MAG: hypothetical protein RR806_05030 [Oscillospiraceae bacterium]